MPVLPTLLPSALRRSLVVLLCGCAVPATSRPADGDGLVLRESRILITPVQENRVTVTGLSGAAVSPTHRVTLVVEAVPLARGAQHLGHVTASASVSLASDGSFGPVVLAGDPLLDPILPGYQLEMQGWTADGEPGPFMVRTLEPPATP